MMDDTLSSIVYVYSRDETKTRANRFPCGLVFGGEAAKNQTTQLLWGGEAAPNSHL